MLTTEKIIFLTKWINNWKRTYGEDPTLEECITCLEWKFKDSSISQKEKESILEVISHNKF